jgi:hypothetical protein
MGGERVLMANTHLSVPPEQRTDLIAPNALAFAKNVGICVLPTAQLLNALAQKQAGTFDDESFWSKISATAGVTSFQAIAPTSA